MMLVDVWGLAGLSGGTKKDEHAKLMTNLHDAFTAGGLRIRPHIYIYISCTFVYFHSFSDIFLLYLLSLLIYVRKFPICFQKFPIVFLYIDISYICLFILYICAMYFIFSYLFDISYMFSQIFR